MSTVLRVLAALAVAALIIPAATVIGHFTAALVGENGRDGTAIGFSIGIALVALWLFVVGVSSIDGDPLRRRY